MPPIGASGRGALKSSNLSAQATSLVELHQQLRECIARHCISVPPVRTIQMARGITATPYPMCNMLPAIYLRAPLESTEPAAIRLATLSMELALGVVPMSWCRSLV